MTSGTTARLYVHRAESGHALVAGLAAVLAEPPDDPFVPDLIAVPTQGIERLLAQQLSHHLGVGSAGQGGGVCANVAFRIPTTSSTRQSPRPAPSTPNRCRTGHTRRSECEDCRPLWGFCGKPSSLTYVGHGEGLISAISGLLTTYAKQGHSRRQRRDSSRAVSAAAVPRPIRASLPAEHVRARGRPARPSPTEPAPPELSSRPAAR